MPKIPSTAQVVFWQALADDSHLISLHFQLPHLDFHDRAVFAGNWRRPWEARSLLHPTSVASECRLSPARLPSRAVRVVELKCSTVCFLAGDVNKLMLTGNVMELTMYYVHTQAPTPLSSTPTLEIEGL